jgi:hypothetical protein
VAGGDALERVGDERAGAPTGIRSRLLLHLPDLACELMTHEIPRTLEELLPRRVHGEAGDALEGRQGIVLRQLQLVLERLRMDLAVAETLLAPRQLLELGFDLFLLLEDALLDLDDPELAVLNLRLDLAP